MKVSLDGGTPTALAFGLSFPCFISVDASGVYWTNLGTSTNNYTDGSVMKVSPK